MTTVNPAMSQNSALQASAIITIGTELTDGEVVDTNSQVLAEHAHGMGYPCIWMCSVPDDRELIASALEKVWSIPKVKLVFIAGGLGPTSDDFTRQMVADHLKLDLIYSEESAKKVEKQLLARGAKLTSNQWTQCWFPKGARRLENPIGTAEGFEVSDGAHRQCYVVLPGPPSELKSVLRKAQLSVAQAEESRIYRIRTTGIGEGRLEDFVQSFVGKVANHFGYRAHMPFVDVKIEERWLDSVDIAALEAAIRAQFGNESVVAKNGADVVQSAFQSRIQAGDRMVPMVVIDRATGGLLQSRLVALSAELLDSMRDLESKGTALRDPLDRVVFESHPVSKSRGSLDAALNWHLGPEAQGLVLCVSRNGKELVVEACSRNAGGDFAKTHVKVRAQTDLSPAFLQGSEPVTRTSTWLQPEFFGDPSGRRAKLWAAEVALIEVAELLKNSETTTA